MGVAMPYAPAAVVVAPGPDGVSPARYGLFPYCNGVGTRKRGVCLGRLPFIGAAPGESVPLGPGVVEWWDGTRFTATVEGTGGRCLGPGVCLRAVHARALSLRRISWSVPASWQVQGPCGVTIFSRRTR